MSAADIVAAAVVLAAAVWAVWVVVRHIRSERRADAAWAAHMRRVGARCPACQPWGGWSLGAMKSDGGYEIINCSVCNGTGELPAAPPPESAAEGDRA